MTDAKPITTTGAAKVHAISISRTRWAANGARYRVEFEGRTLIASSRDPEFDAARALLAEGLTGILETKPEGAAHSGFRIDIEMAAKLGTTEGRVSRPSIRPWVPYSRGEDAEGEG